MSGDARPKDLSSPDSRLTSSDLTSRASRLAPSASLRLTLKAWPVIAATTIGLSFLTQQVATWCGIALPEQANIDLVKRCLTKAFSSGRAFGVAAFLVAQVVILLPAVEEFVFRYLLFMLPGRIRRGGMRSAFGRVGLTPSARVASVADGTEAVPPVADGTEAVPPVADGTEAVPHVAIVLAVFSSALFSAAHYIAQPWPDNAFLALFFFGLAQCWLYRRTGRIWCVMLNHALFNLTNLVLFFLVPV